MHAGRAWAERNRYLRQLGVVQADVLVLVQRVERVHLRLVKLKVEDVAVGDDALLRVGFGQRDEAVVSRAKAWIP